MTKQHDSTTGHVFVVRGRIGEVVADGMVVSTDRDFGVEESWRRAIGGDRGDALGIHKPDGWRGRGYGRSQVPGSDAWFLDVTDEHDCDAEGRFRRLDALLTEMHESVTTSKIKGRVMPLFVLPVIGTHGGGFGNRRGEAISQLLKRCVRFVGDRAADVAIVTPTASVHSALQYVRRSDSARYFQDVADDAARDIGARAKQGSLGLFIGAGASVPAGLPAWKELLGQLVERADLAPEIIEAFPGLGELDKAQLLHQALPDLSGEVVKIVGSGHVPALAHLLLVALHCQQAVTTNYDTLYEQAARSADGQVTIVLPSEVPKGDERWLLKLHGSVESPSTIVLTRGQFASFDASSGPSGAVLQALLLTRHLLVVGTSMTDDNVLRLIHEVAAYRRSYGKEDADESLGTVLDVSADPARAALYREYFNWISMPGSEVDHRARHLEMFLDCASAYASNDMSWLLDERFDDLLSEEGRPVADQLRGIADTVRPLTQGSDAWREVSAVLRSLGARAT